MTEKEAREILKPFEHYKVFPFAWLDKDLAGNYSAMTTAEAKGFLAGIEAERERVKPLLIEVAKLLNHFQAIGSKQHRLLVEGQTFESASENWGKATEGSSFDLENLMKALAAYQSKEENI